LTPGESSGAEVTSRANTLNNPPPFKLMHGESRSAVPPPIQQRVGVTFKESDFDDSTWQVFDAPHDFIMYGTYDQAASLKHGYFPRNVSGWYRKHFTLPEDWKGGATWLHFDGIFQVCDIFLNGHFVTRHTAGYLGFDVRLDEELLQVGSKAGTNVLAIRVDASFGSGHWYEGGGLTRKTFILHTPSSLRFAPDGVFAQTKASAVPSIGNATVVPSAEVVSDVAASAFVRYTIVDRAHGAVVAEASTRPASVAPASKSTPTVVGGATLSIASPRLWSIRTPVLYTLTASLVDASTNLTVDSVNITIGLRDINWEAAGGGFALNHEPVHLRGFSHHEDFGGVGVAVPDRINLFRANALRSVGGNTWRTSHNPYNPVVYDLMDATGILCWDENREFTTRDTGNMLTLVRRDRNHPSVIVWSACNEIECVVSGAANKTALLMRDATKAGDTTRPFSANSWMTSDDLVNNLARYLDVEGFSHGGIGLPNAQIIHKLNPGKAMVSSECCSCRSQRGEDFLNESAGIIYPHSMKQAQCLEGCMQKSYPYWRENPSPKAGVIAGTLGGKSTLTCARTLLLPYPPF
jgi:beta-galactosidase/beta-glucuronidase